MKFFFPVLTFILTNLQAFSQSGEWAWITGDTISGSPVWGTKGVADPLNTPPRMYAYYHWQDTSGNFWVYNGNSSGLSGYNALWKFDLQTQSWTWMHGDSTLYTDMDSYPVYGTQGIPSPDNTPGHRWFSGLSWTDNNGKFWLYSGAGKGADMWMYDPAINEWTWMQGTQEYTEPSYGTYQVSSPSNTPGTNSENNATWVDDLNNLWFYGGSATSNGALWKFDPSTLEWTWMSGSDLIYSDPVYGELGVPSTSNRPGGRWCYASWTDDDGNFMFFGGHHDAVQGEYDKNDLWKYDLSDQTWTWMGGDTIGNQPGISGSSCQFSPSFIPGAAFENRGCAKDSCGNIWMYGGLINSSYSIYSDLWIYRPATNDWAMVQTYAQQPYYGTKGIPDGNNTPGGRCGSVIWFDHDGAMWLFGGIGWLDGYLQYKGELWKYIPDASCMEKACVFTEVNEYIGNDMIKVSPNPAHGFITVQLDPSLVGSKIFIKDLLGKLIQQVNASTTTVSLTVGDISPGIYLLQVDKDGKQWVKKILIE